MIYVYYNNRNKSYHEFHYRLLVLNALLVLMCNHKHDFVIARYRWITIVYRPTQCAINCQPERLSSKPMVYYIDK